MTTLATVGDIIKSFDFYGHDDHYMIGEVIAIEDDGHIVCRTIKVVLGGEIETEIPAQFRTLQQGLRMMDADHHRVVILG